jgi:predicted 3-demethylubiquinone-9 3-methyltransferase (glyoxalase superfamily)
MNAGAATSVIKPCLWFNGNGEDAAKHYVALFPDSAITSVSRYGANMPFAEGTAMMVEFTLGGRPFQALNGGPQFPFTEAISLSISAADQAELDHYWAGLALDGGTINQCGWCQDKYGVSWQIVPQAMGDMATNGTPEQVGRMMAQMMTMTKLDIAPLQAAFEGEG